MIKYQITLTPVDKFFFGGEMTFQVGNDENDEYNTQFKSYIIKSSMYPQQTSLLGMLRFLILRNGGKDVFKDGSISNKDNAKKLIGGRSFSVTDTHCENDFGVIKSLSHVRVRKTKDDEIKDLEFAPLFKELEFQDSSKGTYNLNDFCIPNISPKEYNAKDGLSALLTDGERPYNFEDIFKEDRRVGVNRNIKTGKTDDGALFKQVSYRFNNKDAKYCFVFEVEVADSVALDTYDKQVVTIGADNSQFVLGISKEIKKCSNMKTMNHAVCLLSPTFLSRKEAQQATFAVTRLVSFRFLSFVMTEVNSYHVLQNRKARSDKFELYAPGSVFYFESEEQKLEFTKIIESKKEFRQIGYNEYK